MGAATIPSVRRPVLATIAGGIACLTVLLGAVDIVTSHLSRAHWTRTFVLWALVTFAWLPVLKAASLLLRRSWSRRRFWTGAAVLVLTTVVLQPVWLGTVAQLLGEDTSPYAQRLVAWSHTNVLIVVGILAACSAIEQQRGAMHAELAALRLTERVQSARLHILTLQLQPHFIFNALNLISELAFREPLVASAMLGDLRSLLVESMQHAFHRETTLEAEVGFVRSYLSIQQRRFRDRLHVAFHVEREVLDAAVPHLLLQPLVENAIVHGFSRRSLAGTVTIVAQCAADRLVLSVTDDGAGIEQPIPFEGLGLSNTRLRLEQLYGQDYRLSIVRRAAGGTAATILIPFRRLATAGIRRADVSDLEMDAHEISLTRAADEPVAAVNTRLAAILAWSAMALLWTQSDAAARALGGPRPDWPIVVMTNVLGASLWLLLTPLLVRLTAVTSRLSMSRRVVAHLIAAATTAAVHLTVWLRLTETVVDPARNTIRRDLAPWYCWDIIAYFGIVAFAAIIQFASRRRAQIVAAQAARVNLRMAHDSALRLRLHPRLLVDCLDALEKGVRAEPRRSERAIARMGDLLRLLLHGGAAQFMALDQEVALLEAYLDVVAMQHGERVGRAAERVSVEVRDASAVAIASLALTSIAAALGGRTTAVAIAGDRRSLTIEIVAADACVDTMRVDELRRRLAVAYGHGILVSIASDDSGCVTGRCCLPMRRTSEIVDPQDWTEADLHAASA